MAHQRQLIREAVKAQLLGKTPAAARVYETRMVPWRGVELPAISVYTLSESIDPDSQKTAPRELQRTLKLLVMGVVVVADNVDDALDDLAVDIERAIDADPYFGGAAHDSILSAVQLGVDADGGKPLGVLEMTYSVTYFTDAPAAADVAPLPDFATAGITTDISGTTAAGNQAQDVVAIPTT